MRTQISYFNINLQYYFYIAELLSCSNRSREQGTNTLTKVIKQMQNLFNKLNIFQFSF